MIFLPIVERELRVASRRRGLYWTRFAAALAAAGLCAWVILALSDTPHEAGVKSFLVLSALAFIYAAIAGIQASCDCLSEEKREGTLGLLFLTDLRAYDIVFGKLAARSVNTFYGLVAVIPVLAIPLLLGGVNSAEFWRVALVTVNLLFFFLALGLFASAACRKDQLAITLAVFLALFLLGAIPLAVYVQTLRSAADHALWLVASPATACFTAFEDVYTPGGKPYFWLTVIVTQVYGWSFLALACFLTPRSWQEQNVSAANWRDQWLGFSPGRKLALRRALLEANPFLWRSSRPEYKRLLVWIALALCLGGWAGFARMVQAEVFLDSGTNTIFLVTVNLLLKCWIALEAAQAFSEDRRSGGFELLLSTPLPEQTIIRGQDLALWRQFGGPIVAVFGAHVVLLLTALLSTNYPGTDGRRDLIALYLILAGSLAADALALSRWSMWLGLSGRKPIRAALFSLAWIVVMPVALFAAVATLRGVLAPQAPSRGFSIFWWCALGLATDLFFTVKAQINLTGRFRECAANAPRTQRRELPARS